MVFQQVLIIIMLVVQLALAVNAKVFDRPFLYIFFFSTLYFSFLGPLYWAISQDYYFVGVNWRNNYWDAPFLLAGVSLAITFLVSIFSRYVVTGTLRMPKSNRLFDRLIFFFGIFSAIYVVTIGGIGVSTNADRVGGFTLIAYQASDLIIPFVLIGIARYGFNKNYGILTILFIVYASYVGLRYKIILIAIPFSALFFLGTKLKIKKILIIFGGALLLVFFSLMTVARKKFGGFDIAALSGADLMVVLYGFFAESNVMFGLATVVRLVYEGGVSIGLLPLADSIFDLIPRALLNEKNSGLYVRLVSEGLGTFEGLNSSTTYPFIGEFILMGGTFGLIIGCLFYVSIYLLIKRTLIKNCTNQKVLISGLWLLAGFMGFYWYSRGYLPQIFKGFIFIILPFVFFSRDKYLKSKIKF